MFDRVLNTSLIVVKSLKMYIVIPNFLNVNSFFHNVAKWSNILQKSCGVNTAGFLKYV